MIFLTFISLASFFIYIYMGLVVLFKQPDNSINRIFFLYSIIAVYMCFTDFQMRVAETFEMARFWFRIGDLWHIVLPALVHFVFVFTRLSQCKWVRWLYVPLYLSGLMFSVLDFSANLVVSGPEPSPWGWSYGVLQPTAIGTLFGIWSTGLIVLGIVLCLRFYVKATNAREKQQAKYVLIGTAIPMVAGVTEIVCSSFQIQIPNIIQMSLVLGSAFWAFAIWKYELFVLSPVNTANEIVQAMSDVLLLISPEKRIKVVNRAAVELFGYTREELIDQPVAMLFDEQVYRQGIQGYVSNELAQQSFVNDIETTFRTKTGSKISISLACSVIRDQTLHFQGVAFIGRDITRRKLEEQELRRYQERLEEVVAERTAELEKTYAQLQRVQKLEFMGTLAGGVAHDLNNILSGIVSYPELLLMQMSPDDPLRKSLATIKKSGEKAATIVGDLLTLARREVLTRNVVNLNLVIKEYLLSPERLKMQSYHPFAQIKTQLEPDLRKVVGSPVHLSKAVMNLVHNAVEAMPRGGTVCIVTENRHVLEPISGYEKIEPGEYVTLSVADTGVGIAAEDLERIFEPFYTKKKMGKSGTGLGMAVVWGTAKDHDGFVNVNSRPGAGTTFTLYFPASNQVEEVQATVPMEQYQGRGEKVLVVDDLDEQREIACGILEKLGYQATAVANGEEAVSYVKSHAVDILLLDMIMAPGIDGLETYKQILGFSPLQKAVIVSGYSENKRVKEAQALGVGEFIRKPYTIERIGLALRAELDK